MDPTNFPVPATMEVSRPQPSIPSHGFNHPPYAEMIVNAIMSLKEKNGSSRQAIAKYIDRAYTDLPPTHPPLLTQHLKLLRSNGHLVMNKHCYQLPGGGGGDGGGDEMFDSVATVPLASLSSVVTDSVARKRGRPPRFKPGDQPISVPISDADAPVNSIAITGPAMLSKRKPGRPAKLVSGGPDKVVLGGIKRNPVRSRKIKSVSGGVVVPYLENEVRKGRGRPKKNVTSSQANGGGAVTGKAKGRSRKVDLLKKPIANIGKRRPKQARRLWKNDVPGNGAPMWMVDYGFVKSKLDNVQSRIAQALSELKPYLINQNMPSVAFALHELEEVSTMNLIGAPYQVTHVNDENQV